MEFENMNIENVEEVTDVIEEIVPKKGFKLNAGAGLAIGALGTAAVLGLVALVKKARAKKAAKDVEVEEECDEYGDDYDDYDVDEDK